MEDLSTRIEVESDCLHQSDVIDTSLLTYGNFTIGWKTYDIIRKSKYYFQGNKIASIDEIGEEFMIAFAVKMLDLGKWSITFQAITNNDAAQHISNVLMISYDRLLKICYSTTKICFYFPISNIEKEKWMFVEIVQRRNVTNYFLSIFIDGVRVQKMVNKEVEMFHNLTIFASNLSIAHQHSRIRYFRLFTKIVKFPASSVVITWKNILLGVTMGLVICIIIWLNLRKTSSNSVNKSTRKRRIN